MIALGKVGVWSRELRYNKDREAVLRAVQEIERLGFAAVWIPDAGGDPIGIADDLLGATDTLVAATGILNIWMHDPADVVAAYRAIDERRSGRFLLGIGNSHAPLVDVDSPGRYRRPVAETVRFLDGLEAAGLDTRRTVLMAALGPRMQDLVRERCAGAHPYLVKADYIAAMREHLGPDSFLAPELSVALDADPERARARAREHLAGYFQLPNYRNNFMRLGYGDADLADGGSDRFVTDVVSCGTVDQVAERVAQYLAAGADHVCLQVVGVPDEQLPLAEWSDLAQLTRETG